MKISVILFLILFAVLNSNIYGQISGIELEQRRMEKLISSAYPEINTLRGGAPEQDCNSALAVCQNTFVQPTAYSGDGSVDQEVPGSSCLGEGEKNSVWYIFTVQTAGTLEFTIDPNDNSDDYDFALYNLTGNNCSDISTGSAPEVRCNYCVETGNTGISAAGQNDSEPCCTNDNCQFSTILNVSVGQTFVLIVSNFSSSQSGYTLTFGGTANIFDVTPPSPASVITPCGVNFMDLQMSESVLCNSISANGSEFSLTGPGGPFTFTGATGVNCGTATQQLTISFSPQVIIGSVYTLTINTGTDGNTLIDNCGNALQPGTTLTFTAVPTNAEITGPGNVCAGSEITLSASDGTQYEWSNGATTQSITVSPTVTTTYTVTVTSGTCVQTASQTVNVKPSPIADFSFLPVTPCAGDIVNFTSQSTLLMSCLGLGQTVCTSNANCAPFPCSPNISIFTYNYGDGEFDINANPSHVFDNPGTYNVSLTIADVFGGCSNEISFPITVLASGSALVLPDDRAICLGESTTITAIGGASYSWVSNPPGFTSTDATITVSPNVTTTYSATAPGCSGNLTGSIIISVNPLPTISVTPNGTTICRGESANLTASGAITYSWSPSSGLNMTTGASVVASPLNTTTYSVSGTDANGCDNNRQITITVTEGTNPIITSDGPTAFCEGDQINVNLNAGNGFSSYVWSNQATSQSINVTEAGSFSVMVTDANGCIGLDTFVIQSIPAVQANAGNNVVICSGESTQLVATGGSNYIWSPSIGLNNPNISNPIANPTINTTYQVTVSQGSCSDVATVTVSVNPLPTISITPDETTICRGQSANLSASGALTYLWSPSSSLNATTGTSVVASPFNTTTYSVIGTDANGCENNSQITITVTEGTNPTITPDGPTAFCEGDQINVNLNAGNGFSGYVWSNQATSQSINVTEVGTFSVIVTDADGCIGLDTIVIQSVPDVQANAGNNVVICSGETTQLVATGGVNYLWSPSTGLSNPNISNPIANPTAFTTYQVTVSQGSCSDVATVTVDVNPLPIVSVGNDVFIAPGESIQLSSGGGVTYSWSPTDGLSASDIENPIASPQQTTTYVVTVTDENGCSLMDSVTVTIDDGDGCRLSSLFIPNAFSPNGDGLNDQLNIHVEGFYDKLEFRIHDRYGNTIFETNDVAIGWDGKVDDKQLSTDAFGYYLKVTCEQDIIARQGTISIIR